MISPQMERLLQELYTTMSEFRLGGRKAEVLAMIKKDPEAFLASILIRAKRELEDYSSPVLSMTLEAATFEDTVLEARQLLDAAATEEIPVMTPA